LVSRQIGDYHILVKNIFKRLTNNSSNIIKVFDKYNRGNNKKLDFYIYIYPNIKIYLVVFYKN